MTDKHALIVDDNPKNSKILAMLLRVQGVDSTAVNHPVKLESMLSSLPDIHVVFLDLEMPMLNGFQVMDQLRANSRFENVPIIAYSVHSDELKNVHHYGFNGFLGKPVDSDSFPEHLKKILAGEGVWVTST